jgi:hypothetical protein
LTHVDHSARPPKLLDEREASRASRKRAWENLQEIRWVLKDIAGIDLPPPGRKTIDLEGRVVKDGVRTALRDRQDALSNLVEAIRKYRKLAEKTPLTLQGARARLRRFDFHRFGSGIWP